MPPADLRTIKPLQFGTCREHKALIRLPPQFPRPRHGISKCFIPLLPRQLRLSSSDKRKHVLVMVGFLAFNGRIKGHCDGIQSDVSIDQDNQAAPKIEDLEFS